MLSSNRWGKGNSLWNISKVGADFVKTSTGFSTGGAIKEDIALMRKTVGLNMGVKASGGSGIIKLQRKWLMLELQELVQVQV